LLRPAPITLLSHTDSLPPPDNNQLSLNIWVCYLHFSQKTTSKS
jgi:hypothetical protein